MSRRPPPAEPLRHVYQLLLEHFGPQGWWPAQTRLEVIVGAVLTQNTAWSNVQRALANLRKRGVLSLRGLRSLPREELAELIRPSGYFNLKAKRLRSVLDWQARQGSLTRLATWVRKSPARLRDLREELLQVHGVGPETADSILLYALDLPSFVSDTYSLRVLARHGWIPWSARYPEQKAFFEQRLPRNTKYFQEFHALIVAVGSTHCRRCPRCDGCPLESLLPKDGPMERPCRSSSARRVKPK